MVSYVSILFISLFYAALSKVYVYSPQPLIEEVKKQTGGHDGFEMSLANFGVIPYGHTIIGRIYYDTENSNGCEPFGEFDFSGDPDDDKHPTPIILVDRGTCTFVKKVRNIEHAGGRLGIVINNQNDANGIIMSDDGSGMGISIPSFLISKKDGDILKEFLAKHGGTHVLRDKKDKQKKKPSVSEEGEAKITTSESGGKKDVMHFDIYYFDMCKSLFKTKKFVCDQA